MPKIMKKTTEEKILTRHPQGKNGKNLKRQTYELFKETLRKLLNDKELTHTELMSGLNKKLKTKFSGNISWYGETVKLDLEARKLIIRTATKPQKYKLK